MADTLLVTGASGFLGRHLVDRLLADWPGARIIAQHTPNSTPRWAGERVHALATRLSDLSNALTRADVGDRFSAVFHLAASTPKASGQEVVTDVLDTNVLGTQSLLEAVAGRTDRLVFASTIDVYAPSAGRLSEASPIGPASVYAASKVMGEVLASSWGTQTDTPVDILRVGHLYGPGEIAYRRLIPVAIQSVLAGDPMIRFGSGSERRDLLHVEDAARLMHAASRATPPTDGPTNLVAGRSYAVAEIMALIADISGGKAEIEERPATGTPRSLEFDATRVRTVLPMDGYTPIADGLRAEYAWFRDRVAA